MRVQALCRRFLSTTSPVTHGMNVYQKCFLLARALQSLTVYRYTQNTTGKNPGQLTQFCSVYASAPDRSSHNIYVYGGYDGLGRINQPVDNVYVLSIPAFEWTLVYSGGGQLNGRREHTCIKPYPDQMLVLGGRALDKGPQSCVDMIRVFNLNTLTFQDTYDTETWSQYEVPSMISSIIGGKYVIPSQ